MRQGIFRYLNDSAGVKLKAATKSAAWQSETLGEELFLSDVFGLLFDVTTAGTSMTPSIEISNDGGTTWHAAYPADVNDDAQASMAAIVATGEKAKMWPVWFVQDRYTKTGAGTESVIDPQTARVRVNVATSGTFVFSCWLISRSYGYGDV